MKITIELSDTEVKALKEYLKEVSCYDNPKITKDDIATEIKGIISANMQTGALGDFYERFVNGFNKYGLKSINNENINN